MSEDMPTAPTDALPAPGALVPVHWRDEPPPAKAAPLHLRPDTAAIVEAA